MAGAVVVRLAALLCVAEMFVLAEEDGEGVEVVWDDGLAWVGGVGDGHAGARRTVGGC